MIIGIAAVDRRGAIGKGGKLPWHYSADMKFFRETTTGHAVVMGRKTWLTIGKPLKNRLNIVLSRDSSIEPQDSLLVLSDVDSVLSFNKSITTDLFVIGGAQIYEAFLPHTEKWIITEVPLTVGTRSQEVGAGSTFSVSEGDSLKIAAKADGPISLRAYVVKIP